MAIAQVETPTNGKRRRAAPEVEIVLDLCALFALQRVVSAANREESERHYERAQMILMQKAELKSLLHQYQPPQTGSYSEISSLTSRCHDYSLCRR
jgi:hypothetical protein